MEKRSRQGPFRPGPGGLPPYLAGRAPEQALLRAVLGDLSDGIPSSREIVLHGPRGNGKTALLAWLQREAAAYAQVDVIRLTPASIPTEAELVERLLPASGLRRFTPDEVSVHGVIWRPGHGAPPSVEAALAARARKRPLILLLDEAHTLDAGIGYALLNASQLVERDLPFLLVLAGTPGLRSHLSSMNASFWNRAERRAIGRLNAEAAAAIREPLRKERIAVDEHVIDHVVRESHGYPFFLQVWGQALWRRVATEATLETSSRITRAEAAVAQAEFDRERDDYYLDRYEELERLEYLPVARAVADAFHARPVLDDPDLDAAVLAGLGAAAGLTGAKDAMRDLGYVWRPEASPKWEPGIPSLMSYVRKYASAPAWMGPDTEGAK